jgi:alpha-N-arabinofuranosidase
MKIVVSLLLTCVVICSGCISLFHQGGNELHVAVNGSDLNAGSKAAPFRTIQAAAEKAMPGDTVTVHAGLYREHINPPRGGISDSKRITFQAAPGEEVTITGSEPAKGWVKESGDTWKLTLPNSYFGKFNPFASTVLGDWFDPRGRVHHLGMVYLNGEWMAEAVSGEEVLKPMTATPLWFASVDPASTVIRAQFPGIDPNMADVEIAKRHTVFTPEKTNIDYITVRGFKLKNAASNWAAPTSGQHGLVTAYWCKGWVIEDNEISYSRCCGIALGKYSDEWDNKRGSQKGYRETIADALKTGGWHKDKIGGHRVRRNHIHHCGQTGIVGSLGCAFSRVENNEIHDINKQDIWDGAEMAGIKFHGAIDTVISGNHIYRCGSSGGLWLDWMTQGTQVTGNLIHDNENCDIFTEVNHGPYVIANNILLSPVSYHSCSPGGAYAHNLITGGVNGSHDGRETPYHKAHSTEVVGQRDCQLGDVRWYNNLLAGKCSLTSYDKAVLPVAAAGNVFTKGAQPSKFDKAALLKPDFDPGIKLTQQADGWYLEMNVDKAWATEQKRQVVGKEMLGKAVIPDLPFENADGSPLKIDTDYFGKKRETTNPFPGPFEVKESGKQTIKVWPLASTPGRAGAPNFWDEIPLSPSTRLPSVVLDDYWNSEFQRVNREVAAAQNTQLIFLGDSITWSWTLGPATGKEIWEAQFAAYKPINMGNSGDITPVMLHRVTRGNLDFADGQHPKVAVLLCGINNLGVSHSAGGREQWYLGANCPPADIANGIRAIAQVFRRRLPGTRLIMMATLPVSDEVKRATCRQASAINASLARNDNEVAFLDLQEKYLLPDGSLNKQLFTDGTHLTTEGYRVWAKGIEPLVQKFMEAPPLKPVKIMLIGDSMTEGADSNSSYRRYLDGMLRRDGHLIDFVGSRKKHNDDKTEPDNYEYDVDHEGHWGKSSAWMAENMQGLLASHVPDVAVIHLGTEDILSSNAAAEPLSDEIVKNIGKVVDTLRAKNGNVKIVLSTIIPVAGKQDVVNMVNLKISSYVQSNSTRPCPVFLADPCKGFDVSTDLSHDNHLPNAAGARRMARVFADVIQ